MSFQRILETARRRGLPMIVTDVAGREPLVVLSLAEYERLTDGSKMADHQPVAMARPSKEEPNIVPNVVTTTLQEIVEKKAELEEALLDLATEARPSTSQSSELSLEERFYLEPIDEEQP